MERKKGTENAGQFWVASKYLMEWSCWQQPLLRSKGMKVADGLHALLNTEMTQRLRLMGVRSAVFWENGTSNRRIRSLRHVFVAVDQFGGNTSIQRLELRPRDCTYKTSIRSLRIQSFSSWNHDDLEADIGIHFIFYKTENGNIYKLCLWKENWKSSELQAL